jgi:hypothetical protein
MYQKQTDFYLNIGFYIALLVGVFTGLLDVFSIYIYFFVELLIQTIFTAVFYKDEKGKGHAFMIIFAFVGVAMVFSFAVGIFLSILDSTTGFIGRILSSDGPGEILDLVIIEFWPVIIVSVLFQFYQSFRLKMQKREILLFTHLMHTMLTIFGVISLSILLSDMFSARWPGWFALCIVAMRVFVDIYLYRSALGWKNKKPSVD